MTFTEKIKKGLIVGLAALTLGGGLAASTAPAEAGWRTGTWRYWGHGPHWGYRPYWGYRHWGYRPYYGGAVAAGLALGALAAAPSYAYPGYRIAYGYGDCYIVHRRFVDPWGYVRVRRVQVCD